MNARNRNLILVTNQLDAVSYYVVATLRLLLSDPLFFLIGYWYGDTALTWMEQRTKTYGSMLRQWERWFAQGRVPARVHRAQQRHLPLRRRRRHERRRRSSSSTSPARRPALPDPPARRGVRATRSTTSSTSSRDYRAPLLVVSITFFAVMMVRELRQSKEDLEALEEAIDEDADAGELARQIGAGSERWSTPSSSAHASGNASRLQNDSRSKSVPRRSPRWIDSASPWRDDDHRRARGGRGASRPRRRPARPRGTCGSHPSGCSPRR